MSVRHFLLPVVAGTAMQPGAAAEWSGELELGWRNVSVQGDTAKFEEDINLDDGARLFDAAIHYRNADPGGVAPDSMDLELRGLGGEPFESMRLDVARYGKWRLRARRFRSDYLHDDLLVPVAEASIDGSTGGDFHRYDTERVREDVTLDMRLGPRLETWLSFARNARSGDGTTTLDVQRDEFELDQRFDEQLETQRAGLRYRHDRLSLTVQETLYEFEADSPLVLPGQSAGINPADAAVLDFFSLAQPYRYRGHEHSLRADARPAPRLRVVVSMMFADFDASTTTRERAAGIDFRGQPFSVDEVADMTSTRDVAGGEMLLSYSLNPALLITAAATRRSFEQDANGTAAMATDDSDRWRIETTGWRGGLRFSRGRMLSLATGWYAERRDITRGAGSDRADTDLDGYYAAVTLRPADSLSLRVDVNSRDIDNPFTLAASRSTDRYRMRVRWRLQGGFSITASHRDTGQDNRLSEWASEHRETGVRVAYATDALNLFAGITRVTSDVNYTRRVAGGFRVDVLAAAQEMDTLSRDLAVNYDPGGRWTAGGFLRDYDNEGSLPVWRRDWALYAEIRLTDSYALRVTRRRVNFREDALEAYRANLTEIALRQNF